MIKPPWSAIRWGHKAVIDQIINDYRSCPNVVEIENKLYCYTWYRHDDCVRLMELLNRITKNDLYSLPKTKPVVRDAIEKMINDPDTAEILRRLEDNGI
jgi:hypothetical protein